MKPPYISHYLFLRDLIHKGSVSSIDDKREYLTSRLSNVKLDLKKRGLKFVEDIEYKNSKYATYKPYKLIPSEANIAKAKEVLESLGTVKIKEFLGL